MAPEDSGDPWKFELYVIGDNRRSTLAMENLRGICKDHLNGMCRVDVYDVREHPEIMAERNLCVAPTLIRKYPLPEKMLIGDLSITERVLQGLDLDRPEASNGENVYSDGLRRQNLTFKWHHEQPRR